MNDILGGYTHRSVGPLVPTTEIEFVITATVPRSIATTVLVDGTGIMYNSINGVEGIPWEMEEWVTDQFYTSYGVGEHVVRLWSYSNIYNVDLVSQSVHYDITTINVWRSDTITSMQTALRGNVNVHTLIPSFASDTLPLCTNFADCFSHLNSLVTPLHPNFMGGDYTRVLYMNQCFGDWASYAGPIPIVNASSYANYFGCYYGNSLMTGTGMPVVNSAPNSTSYASCFKGCTSLSDYAQIPSGWK